MTTAYLEKKGEIGQVVSIPDEIVADIGILIRAVQDVSSTDMPLGVTAARVETFLRDLKEASKETV